MLLTLTVSSYQLSVISFIVGGNTTPIGPFVVRRAVGISVGGGFKSPTKARRHCGWYCLLF
ncbi:hypothetical protein [Scytonema sp. PCC 10023]|uniref:hypothetical protein n=1 Tax=Scytonema sp. PCC 10023 TaxID=1680591 RepID=UPI0039C5F18B